jgi:hypothetical protein
MPLTWTTTRTFGLVCPSPQLWYRLTTVPEGMLEDLGVGGFVGQGWMDKDHPKPTWRMPMRRNTIPRDASAAAV